jgi:GNAT superfamily N-acetyltransferase
MKAGTAQKMVLNMISTGAMIKNGRTFGNLMSDMRPTNEKLRKRAVGIVSEIADIPYEVAETRLKNTGWNMKMAIDIDKILAFWNEHATKMGYKPFNEAEFTEFVIGHKDFDDELFFIMYDDDEIIGMCCGVEHYISFVIAKDDDYGIFCQLLERLESKMKERGKTKAELIFFNPMKMPWLIKDDHEHNNMPGVPLDSVQYEYMLKCGYTPRATQTAYHKLLADFTIPDKIIEKRNFAVEKGYNIGFHHDGHYGIEEMLDSLGNHLWCSEIPECVEQGKPVLFADLNGKVVGFAGPVICQPNGRGYFTGIAVAKEHEGVGLGSVLFYRLCEAFKDIGVVYMSLFTGEENWAKYIYLKAGFEPKRQFAVMHKDL